MKSKIIKFLAKAQEEIKKRFSIKESYGLDMANYENSFSEIFTDMLIEYFKYIGCENSVKPYESLKDQIEYWLWEENYEIMYKEQPMWIKSEKRAFIEMDKPIGYVINIKNPKDFYDYIVNTYQKVNTEVKAKYTLTEVRALLEKQKERIAFGFGLRSDSFCYPKDSEKISKIVIDSPNII